MLKKFELLAFYLLFSIKSNSKPTVLSSFVARLRVCCYMNGFHDLLFKCPAEYPLRTGITRLKKPLLKPLEQTETAQPKRPSEREKDGVFFASKKVQEYTLGVQLHAIFFCQGLYRDFRM